ncbi:MAG: DUF4079 domain-containing protein [Vulcanococcus sp.]
MTAIQWGALLHPVLIILFVYPLVGATIRLGILVREKRLGITQQPDLVPIEHADHGRWLCTGAVVVVLVALLWNFAKAELSLAQELPLLAVAAGCLGSVLALGWVRRPALRAAFGLLAWLALLALGLQPSVWRLSDQPWDPAFWQSHFWAGWLLCGLLLLSTAARPELQRSLAWRRLHMASGLLMALLLAVQAISGCRDLFQIALHS